MQNNPVNHVESVQKDLEEATARTKQIIPSTQKELEAIDTQLLQISPDELDFEKKINTITETLEKIQRTYLEQLTDNNPTLNTALEKGKKIETIYNLQEKKTSLESLNNDINNLILPDAKRLEAQYNAVDKNNLLQIIPIFFRWIISPSGFRSWIKSPFTSSIKDSMVNDIDEKLNPIRKNYDYIVKHHNLSMQDNAITLKDAAKNLSKIVSDNENDIKKLSENIKTVEGLTDQQKSEVIATLQHDNHDSLPSTPSSLLNLSSLPIESKPSLPSLFRNSLGDTRIAEIETNGITEKITKIQSTLAKIEPLAAEKTKAKKEEMKAKKVISKLEEIIMKNIQEQSNSKLPNDEHNTAVESNNKLSNLKDKIVLLQMKAEKAVKRYSYEIEESLGRKSPREVPPPLTEKDRIDEKDDTLRILEKEQKNMKSTEESPKRLSWIESALGSEIVKKVDEVVSEIRSMN